MVEEKAIVIGIEGNTVWVETQRKAVCDTCAVNKGCGTALLSKILGNKRSRLQALSNNLSFSVGDEVIIGLQERALVRGSMLVYGLPLLLMLLAALLAEVAAKHWLGATSTELLTIVVGGAGLFAGLLYLHRYSRRIAHDPRYQPVVLRAVSWPETTGSNIEHTTRFLT